jgi:uncharacterized protein GlcG (DUF336 family)
MTKRSTAAALCAAGLVFANPLPGLAQDVLTTHRLSAALDTVEQATLRGDGASTGTLDSAHDKAYTVLTLGAARNEDTSGAIAQRIGPTPSAGGLAKLPHMLLAQGAIRIKIGAEAIGAIGVGGAPGGELDEACAKAGLDKISGRLK